MRHSISLVGACALALAALPAHAAGIHKCKTLGGRTVISDKPCTQESLGKEGLKLATPEPEAAKPPETSPDYATGHSGKARTAPDAGPSTGSLADRAESGDSANTSLQKAGVKREEEAEKKSGM